MKVAKHSKKPFKSGSKINTVKTEVIHPITNRPAFTFYEDDSIVEQRMCLILAEEDTHLLYVSY